MRLTRPGTYRGLLNQILKVMLRVLDGMIRERVDCEIDEDRGVMILDGDGNCGWFVYIEVACG